MARSHRYKARIEWTGNTGAGTADYRTYSRDHEIAIDGKPSIAGSADPAFRGDAARANPEDLLLGAISTCHMLWFLHLCADAGVVVEAYVDEADAEMTMNRDGSGQFSSATLHPHVTISAGDADLIDGLHHKAHEMCYIARSVNFEIAVDGTVAQIDKANA